MRDIVIRKDLTVYQIEGEAIRRFDEANPPRVPAGVRFAFFPVFTNKGIVTRLVTQAAAVTDPLGQLMVLQWFFDPTIPLHVRPGDTGGIGFFFVPQAAGNYTARYRVYADGVLSDSWQVVVCRVGAPPPPVLPPIQPPVLPPIQPPVPPPPVLPPPEAEAIAGITGLVGLALVAELVVGLVEGIAE